MNFSRSFFALALAAATLVLILISGELFAAQKGPQRQKAIDFEDEIVEGMNKRPLDSLSQISEADRKRRKSHLYRKRVGFKTETRETLEELRTIQ